MPALAFKFRSHGLVNDRLVEGLTVNCDAHYFQSLLMTRWTAEALAYSVQSAANMVRIDLSSTLIELLGLVEILLYATVHYLSHLLAGTVLFLRCRGDALGLTAIGLEQLIRDACRARWKHLVVRTA